MVLAVVLNAAARALVMGVVSAARGRDDERPSSAAATTYFYRKLKNKFMVGLTIAATVITLLPLFFVLATWSARAPPASTWPSLLRLPKPVGEVGGGMANAIVGTFELVGLASADRRADRRLARAFICDEYGGMLSSRRRRFAADVLMGMPSIVVGIFAYAMVVRPMGGFSTLWPAASRWASS